MNLKKFSSQQKGEIRRNISVLHFLPKCIEFRGQALIEKNSSRRHTVGFPTFIRKNIFFGGSSPIALRIVDQYTACVVRMSFPTILWSAGQNPDASISSSDP